MGCCFADMNNGDLLYGTDGTGLYVLDNNFQVKNEMPETKSKAKTFWKVVGTIFLAVCLAFLTVVVLNLNK